MKILKVLIIIFAAGFLLIQIYRPARINLPIVSAETLEASTQVPEDVNKILKKSCNDCHTNQTDWRWYSNIAPISWKMVEHVDEGRKELNFSEWATYSVKRKDRKLDEICEQVETREMPYDQYLWIHRDAELSIVEIELLCDWTKTEREKLSAVK